MTSFIAQIVPPQSDVLLRFSPFSLLPDGTLLRGGESIPIPPKELAILRVLLANSSRIVTPEELHGAGWGKVHVSPDSLPRCISSLRARLNSHTCIQTVYKRGYRFTLPVESTPVAVSQVLKEGQVERRSPQSFHLPRLVILPFATHEGVPEAFGPGVTEETMLQLNRATRQVVDVLARDSVFSLAAQGLNATAVGKALRADLVMAGTITTLPGHFRLRAEMIRVRDEVQLWVEDFLLPRESFAFADAQLAERVSARIRNSFCAPFEPASFQPRRGSIAYTAASAAPESEARPENGFNAYSIFLTARHQWDTLERHRMQDALKSFERAAEMDSSLASARVHLVHGYLYQAYWGYMRPDIAAEQARQQAEILLESHDTTHSLQAALGWIHFFYDRNLAAASEFFAETNYKTYYPLEFKYCTRFLLGQGKHGKALDLLRVAVSADPYSAAVQANLAWAYHLAGDPAAALFQADAALALFPDHPVVLAFCAMIMGAAGRLGDALTERATGLATKLVQSRPYFDAGNSTLAYTYARQGKVNEAREILKSQLWLSRERFVMRSAHVPALVALGDLDAALQELSVIEQLRCPWFFELLQDPRLQPLHNKPEFLRFNGIAQDMQAAVSAA